VLLNRGAKFDVYDKEGHTLLHFARTKGKLWSRALINKQEKIAKDLVGRAGASITARASGDRASALRI